MVNGIARKLGNCCPYLKWKGKLKQKKKRQSFKDAKGEVWGVDISVWLHTIASTNAVSLYLHYDSENIPIDVEEAFIRVIDSRVKMAAKFGIMLTFVFDGHFHQ